MAMNYYELPIDWEPDTTYMNNAENLTYLAWRVAKDPGRGLSIWTFGSVEAVPPVELDTLLPAPEDYTTYAVIDDVPSLGYTRDMSPRTEIVDVEAYMNDSVSIML